MNSDDASPLPDDVGIILVDHGSRVDAANRMLDEVVAQFRSESGAVVVEAAHMELAEPDLARALEKCVAQGARRVIVHPYFLAPGRHSTDDIPRMAREAAAAHPGVEVMVSEPLGLDARMAGVILDRVRACF
jgi:sirohydrochlorin ferrochelatase